MVEFQAVNAGTPVASGDGRVYIYSAGRGAELVVEGRLGQKLEVPPGRYNVRVRFTRSRDNQSVTIRDLELVEGQRLARRVSFSAGGLSVAAAARTSAAKLGPVIVYVFRPQSHDRVITSMRGDEQVVLSAGKYDLRVVLTVDSEEKEVRWLRDVEVKSGVHSSFEVVFQRGSLWVKALNSGQELPSGAAAIMVYKAGDVQEEVVDSGLAGVPLSLAVGRYDIEVTFSRSSDKPSRRLRGLQISEGETLEETVEFASGTVIVDAKLKGGETVGKYGAYVYYYRAGDHLEPVAYTPAGEAVIFQSGTYDLRADFFRSHDQPSVWIRDIRVGPGEVVRKTVAFPSGRLLMRAYDSAGTELLGDNIFLHVYPAGQHARAIASARGSEVITLTEGSYDIRLEDTRHPGSDLWLNDVPVTSGQLVERSADFKSEAEPVGAKRP